MDFDETCEDCIYFEKYKKKKLYCLLDDGCVLIDELENICQYFREKEV